MLKKPRLTQALWSILAPATDKMAEGSTEAEMLHNEREPVTGDEMADIRGPACFLAEAVKARRRDPKNAGKTLDQAVEEMSVELYRVGRGERDVPLAEVRVPTYPSTLGPVGESLRQTLGHLGVRAVLVLALEEVYSDIVAHLISSREKKTEERPKVLCGLRKIIMPWVSEEYGAG